ncbi:MAG: hypothetical protein SH850_30145 [Planctomycetaceae bacterium]|nr:hypothetical protein [Planctomycetaceae bacterium]
MAEPPDHDPLPPEVRRYAPLTWDRADQIAWLMLIGMLSGYVWLVVLDTLY